MATQVTNQFLDNKHFYEEGELIVILMLQAEIIKEHNAGKFSEFSHIVSIYNYFCRVYKMVYS